MRGSLKKGIRLKFDDNGFVDRLELPSSRKSALRWRKGQQIEVAQYTSRSGAISFALKPGLVPGNRNRLCRERCATERYCIRFTPKLKIAVETGDQFSFSVRGQTLWIKGASKQITTKRQNQVDMPLFDHKGVNFDE